jgi:hypothetical protein
MAVLEALEPRRLLSTDIVTSLNDSGAGSLRQTIAGAASGDTIQFAPSLSGGTIILTSGELVIGHSLTITGLGASSLSISGDNASAIFAVSAATTVSISGLTITDGLGIGGGIYNDGSLTITNCTLSSDAAIVGVATGLGFTGDDAGDGGGIFNDAAGTLTISGTTISGGEADLGGGVYNNGGHVTITSSTLSDSLAEQGGGLLNTDGGTVNITGSTIMGNEATYEAGGGICNENSTLTITSSTVFGNAADTYGGGITNYADGTLTISSTVVQGNTAFGDGGGIFNFTGATLTINNGSSITSNTTEDILGGGLCNYQGTANITSSTFSGNNNAYGFGGGAADFDGTLNLTGATFSNNYAELGGALYVIGDTVTIASGTFSSNEALEGGAIYQDSGSSLVVSASTLQGNVANYYGGAILQDGKSLVVSASTLQNNEALYEGGGALIASTAFFSNSTLADNQAEYGGGLISFGAVTVGDSTIAGNGGGGLYVDSGDTATLYNTIVATNTNYYGMNGDITGTLDYTLASGQTPSSHNLIGTGGSGGLSNGVNGNIVGANPDLGPLQNNGGPTNTMALQTGSPAINAGSNALAVDANGKPLAYDQRGPGFARIVGGIVDIGAYEVQSISGPNSSPAISPSPLVAAASLPLPARLRPSASLSRAANATPDFIDLGPVSPAASPASSPFTPSQIVDAYGVNDISFNGVVGNGAGQTIAIIDAYNDPDIISDANAFSAQYGLTQFNGSGEPTLEVLNETGGTSLPSDSSPGGWDVEESLDVEWSHAIAPEANIILFEASYPDSPDLWTAVTTAADTAGVSVVSMSFGEPQLYDFYDDVSETSEDSTFTTPAGHPGVTFLASTGDSGALGVGYPSLSPNVVAVGGTTLEISTDGSYLGESAWSGGGGGDSIQETQPSYQSASINSTGLRATPDVSMDADPETGVYVLDSYLESGYIQVGGTSVATPMWAALIAIVDQGRALKGLSSLDGPSQTLPMLYNLPSSDFHDILTGNNGYPAALGYDLATGLGSPNAALLVPALAGYSSNETWTGAQSNNWYDADNWDSDTVPLSTSNVTINFGAPTAGAGFSIASLTINGGTLYLGAGSGGSSVTSLTITGSGALDVSNNTLFIDYGANPDPIASIRGYLISGRNGGSWNGMGIFSSAAAVNPGYALGYADGEDGVVSGLSSGQIEVKYALLGDANLDGLVNGADFNILAANFNQSITGWDQGDFNYDGLVNAADFNDLAANFNQGVSGASVASSAAVLDAPAAPAVAPTASTVTISTAKSAAATTTAAPAVVSVAPTVATVTAKSTAAAPPASKSKPLSVSKAVISDTTNKKPKASTVAPYAAGVVTVPSAGSVSNPQDIRNKDEKFLADR